MKIFGLLVVIGVLVCACTYTDIAVFKAYARGGHIVCYSGGKTIFEGDSIGEIQPEWASDGWKFMDSRTEKLHRVSGDCVITN